MPKYSMDALETKLDERAPKLFCRESDSSVDIFDQFRPGQTYNPICIQSLSGLESYLQSVDPEPCTRFVFIHAPHSRERLRISRRMFNYLSTYLQVPPTFLEYLFTFGRQHYPHDFLFSGFRDFSQLSNIVERERRIPRLSLSGRQIELCYSLKSVERTGDSGRPWSVRQCSVYHFNDLETQRTVWLTVKGNELIKQLIQAKLALGMSSDSKSQVAPSLQHTLSIHLLLCSWAAENWRPYISSLEQLLQDKTRRALSFSVEPQQSEPQSQLTVDTELLQKPTSGDRRKKWTRSGLKLLLPGYSPKKEESVSLPDIELETASQRIEIQGPRFSFDDLQRVQKVEEQAAEALHVLKSNTHTMLQLRDVYLAVVASPDVSDTSTPGEAQNTKHFAKSVDNIIADLTIQQTRVDSLSRLLTERKSLLYGILQYQNTESSRILAEKAQLSTFKMEQMTHEMHIIAKKTKAETVSMRIITLVTLFFLPGTFISTLMSTPIVNFDGSDSPNSFSDQNIGVGALRFYIVVSLPLVCLTFFAWYIVYWWETRQEAQKAKAKLAAGCLA